MTEQRDLNGLSRADKIFARSILAVLLLAYVVFPIGVYIVLVWTTGKWH